jgi:hypothetical protein
VNQCLKENSLIISVFVRKDFMMMDNIWSARNAHINVSLARINFLAQNVAKIESTQLYALVYINFLIFRIKL